MSKVQKLQDKQDGAYMSPITYRVTRDDGRLADVWYDFEQKLWTVYMVDERGAQIGSAEYENTKAAAIELAESVEMDHWRISQSARGNW